MDIKNILNRTIVNYILVVLGGIIVGKLGIPGDLWEIARGALEEGTLVAVAGGGLASIVVGAARGIIESQKDKIVLNGQRLVIPPPGETPKTTHVETAAVKDILNEAGDRLVGKVIVK